MAYLPPEHAVEGTELLVEYLGERYPVVVDRVGATPFDPTNERILVMDICVCIRDTRPSAAPSC